MPAYIAYILGVLAALVCTIICLVLVTPENKRASLPKFFQFLHDVFNFKSLLIEKILKFCYIFATLSAVFVGFFLLFSGYNVPTWGYNGIDYEFKSLAGVGILVILIAPIAIRLAYEGIMLAILAVKNIIEINNKLKPQAGAVVTEAPVEKRPEKIEFCTSCGTKYDVNNGNCPNCGSHQ